MFQGSFKGVLRKFQECFKKDSKILSGRFQAVSRELFQRGLKGVSKKYQYQRCFKEVLSVFQGTFRRVSKGSQGRFKVVSINFKKGSDCFKQILRRFEGDLECFNDVSRLFKEVSILLQGNLCVSWLFEECSTTVSGVFQGYFKNYLRMMKGCFRSASKVLKMKFQKFSKQFSRLFQGSFKVV